MPTLIQSAGGRVTAIFGKATIRGADGKSRPLAVGDYVRKGDVILTTQDGIVQINPDAPAPKLVNLDNLEPTAAGDGGGSLGEGLRVGRVGEGTSATVIGPSGDVEASRLADAAREPNIAPLAFDGAVSGNEDTLIPVSLTGRDIDGTVASYTVVRVPTGGVLYVGGATAASKAAQAGGGTGKLAVPGQPIAEGTQLTPEEAANLVFQPAPNFNGNPGDIVFTVTDNDGAVSAPATVTIGIAAVNDPPVPGTVPTGPDGTPQPDPSANSIPNTGNYRYNTPEDVPVNGRVNATDVDNDPLSYAKSSDPLHGSVVVNPDGSFTYTPNTDFNGSDSFVVVVSDGQGGSATSTVFVNVTPVDDQLPPTGADTTRSTPEDLPYVLQANDFGFQDGNPGDTLAAVRIDSLPARGSLTLNGVPVAAGQLVSAADIAAGRLSFIGAPNENGSAYASFTFTVQDNTGLFDDAPNRFSFDVTPVSDTPVAGNDRAVTDEDTAVLIPVLANDSDADVGDTLSIVAINGTPIAANGTVTVANGTVTLRPDGQLLFTPAADYHGSTGFTYTVTDGQTPVTGNVTVVVNPVNDPPVARPDTINTPEDQPVTIAVLRNDSDIDGDPLNVLRFTQPAQGVVTQNPDGTLTYTPPANFNGTVTFTYVATDGRGGESTPATVTITVGGVNDAPVANPDTAVTNEDTPIAVNVLGNDTDADGDTMTVTQVAGQPIAIGTSVAITGPNNVAQGTVTLTPQGTLLFTPARDFNGPVAFSYTISDGQASATAQVNLSVVPVNDAPMAVDDRATTPEDTPVEIAVLGNDRDADGDALTVTQVDGQAIAVGASVAINGTAGAALGSVTLTAQGMLLFTPAPGFNGPVNFSYTISDGQATATAQVSLAVDSVNDAPVARNDLVSGPEDTVLTFDPRANDVDPENDPLTIVSVAGQPISAGTPVVLPQGTITLNADGTLSFTPAANFNGQFTVPYTVTDGKSDPVGANITLQIAAVNDAPSGTDAAETTPEDVPYTLTVANFGFTDVDAGDRLAAVRIDTLATRGTLTLNGVAVTTGTLVTADQIAAGALRFVPGRDENGTPYGSFTFSVQDNNGAFDPTPNTFTLNVTAVSDSPVAGDDVATTLEDTPVFIDVLANDTDADAGDVLRITAVNGQALSLGGPAVNVTGAGNTVLGTVALVLQAGKPQLLFTPAKDYNGPVNFRYTVTDGLTSVDAQVAVAVQPVNDAPVANADNVTTAEDTPVIVNVLRNDTDVDGDALTVTTFTQPANGRVVLNADGTFTYTPNANFNGAETFSYTITDPSGATSSATVTVNVGGVNDAPVANPDTDTTSEDTALVRAAAEGVIAGRTPAAADTDADGNTLSVTSFAIVLNGVITTAVAGQPLAGAWGTLTLNADGSYRYQPNAAAQGLDDGETGVDTFSYTVTDGSLNSTTTLTLTVTGANDAPVAVDDSATTREGVPVTVAVLANDLDVDNEPLTVTQVNGRAITATTGVDLFDNAPTPNKIGTVTLNADGTLTFTPVAFYNGPVKFTYTMTDGTASATGNVSIVVDDVNDPPIAADDPITGREDTTITFDPRANDKDVDGDPLTITTVNGQPIAAGQSVTVAQGTIGMNADGTLSFTPVKDFNGSFSVPYTIADGRGGVAGANLNFNIVAVNDPPVVVDDPTRPGNNLAPNGSDYLLVTPEDTPVSGKVEATDVDGDTLTYTRTSDPANGTVVFNADGSYTYTPGANFNGNDRFTVLISDGQGGTATSTVLITVTPVNDPPLVVNPPTAGGAATTTDEDTPLVFSTANGNALTVGDVDGDTLTVTITTTSGNFSVSSTNGLTVNGNGGNVVTLIGSVASINAALQGSRFLPPADYHGAAGLTIVASDGAATTATFNVPITITPVADIVADMVPATEDTTQRFNVITGAGGANADNFESPARTLTAINDQAVADGAVIALTDAQGRAAGSITVSSNGDIVYVPAADYNGNPSFSYTVTSGGTTETAQVTLNVAAVNDPPKIPNPPTAGGPGTSVAEDSVLSFSTANGNALVVSDVDGDQLTVTVTTTNGSFALSGTAGLTVSGNGSSVVTLSGSVAAINAALQGATYTPVADYNGTAQLVIVATDGTASTTPVVVPIVVTPVADIVADTVTVNEDANASFNLISGTGGASADNFEDTGRTLTAINGQPLTGQPITLTDAQGRTVGTVTVNANGAVDFVPAPNYNGSASFSYTVTAGGTTETANVTVNVSPVDDRPVVSFLQGERVAFEQGLVAPNAPEASNQIARGTMQATDADGDTAFTWTLQAPTTPVTSQGVAVQWTSPDGGKTLVGMAGAREVANITIDDTGHYVFTLKQPIDHVGPVSDGSNFNLDFKAVAKPAVGEAGVGDLQINVVDSLPQANNLDNTFAAGRVNSNLLLVLDASTSMNEVPAGQTQSRFSLAIQAIQNLLDGYAARGEVRVQLVVFGTTANDAGGGYAWYDIETAKALLSQVRVQANQGTNYDEALADAITAYRSAADQRIPAGPNTVNAAYFFSDGKPTYGSGGDAVLFDPANPAPVGDGIVTTGPDIGISAQEEAIWTTFLRDEKVQSFAVGLDAGVTVDALNPIAFDGTTGTNTNGVVTDLNGLNALLQSTLPPGRGNLISAALTNGVGSADGLFLSQVAVDGQVITIDRVNNTTSGGSFDAATRLLSFTTATGGLYTINVDTTDFTYRPPTNTPTGANADQLTFTLRDFDGDSATATVRPEFSPFVADTTPLTLNGTDADERLTGAAGNDVINGGGGKDLIIGAAGNDQLAGGAGDDLITGGAGNDRLTGGQGSDLLHGGAGADVFAWQLGDGGASGLNEPVVANRNIPADVIGDFDVRQDVLDLRDLLQGETAGALERYLDFDTSGADTIIRISTRGQFGTATTLDNFTAGDNSFNGFRTDQTITLTGVKLDVALGVGQNASDAAIISELVRQGKLITD